MNLKGTPQPDYDMLCSLADQDAAERLPYRRSTKWGDTRIHNQMWMLERLRRRSAVKILGAMLGGKASLNKYKTPDHQWRTFLGLPHPRPALWMSHPDIDAALAPAHNLPDRQLVYVEGYSTIHAVMSAHRTAPDTLELGSAVVGIPLRRSYRGYGSIAVAWVKRADEAAARDALGFLACDIVEASKRKATTPLEACLYWPMESRA